MKNNDEAKLILKRALKVSPARCFYIILLFAFLKSNLLVWGELQIEIHLFGIIGLYLLVFGVSILLMVLESKPEVSITES